ncbi:hypothetical protein Pcinc_020391 [Petrolisthes cinctipes]|uniref:Uncharacterized protein n=1 Tax=Petrolisthes cinctipes TaxID=88211 RepID=A0AAE1FJ85_PETCI|nr:hypothetical protein Pcinc_020391 [Petrolisthes cinctipes]
MVSAAVSDWCQSLGGRIFYSGSPERCLVIAHRGRERPWQASRALHSCPTSWHCPPACPLNYLDTPTLLPLPPPPTNAELSACKLMEGGWRWQRRAGFGHDATLQYPEKRVNLEKVANREQQVWGHILGLPLDSVPIPDPCMQCKVTSTPEKQKPKPPRIFLRPHAARKGNKSIWHEANEVAQVFGK